MASRVTNRASNGKRTRSFGGCATCRVKRVKCTEERPICAKCRESGSVCGYENSLFFDSDAGIDNEQAARFRRPLLTLEQRQQMSEELKVSIPPHLAFWHLAQIDELFESPDETAIHRGPFGAFRIQQQDLSPSVDDDGEGSLDTADEELPISNGSLMSPNTQAAIDTLIGTSTYELDLDLWDAAAGLSGLNDVLPDNTYQMLNFEQPWETIHDQRDVMAPEEPSNRPISHFAISRSISPVSCAQIDIPSSAWVLLKHYLGNVLKAMTPYNHGKTPWHVLFVPLVKNCLAGLALQDEVDRATLCVFYGTLAISASSLSGTTQSSTWARKSDVYREKAYDHARASLQTAYNTPKAAKYKTQLMALLTMAQLSIVSGQQDETEYFLLEAEKFIRVRGLNRRKSRKVRLLHHCYAYERIFFESTAIRAASSSSYQRNVQRAIEASGASAFSKDSLSFKLPAWENLEMDVLKIKDQELGENDLHLQFPGAWPQTLYPEIFGVPEVHLFLISLIIRLARERDDAEESASTLDLKSFLHRSKAIERLIQQQRPASPNPNTHLSQLLEATHQAVVIYFYRRIHDVDSSMLQHQVENIRNCLQQYESSNDEKGFASMRLLWPAYIAACEAESTSMQASFAQWFEEAGTQSGLRLFPATLLRIENAWQEKRRDKVSVF